MGGHFVPVGFYPFREDSVFTLSFSFCTEFSPLSLTAFPDPWWQFDTAYWWEKASRGQDKIFLGVGTLPPGWRFVRGTFCFILDGVVAGVFTVSTYDVCLRVGVFGQEVFSVGDELGEDDDCDPWTDLLGDFNACFIVDAEGVII